MAPDPDAPPTAASTDATAEQGRALPESQPATGPLGLAAAASAAAGLVHAAAAGSHAGDRTLAVLFALSAVAQVGWAAAAARHPSRTVALTGAALNAGMALAWLASRTVGLPLVGTLREPEPATLQDTTAAVLAVVAAVGSALATRPTRPRRSLPPVLAVGLAGLVVALAVPAMAAEHAHGDGEVDEVAAHAHGHGEVDEAAAHAHGDAVEATGAGHDQAMPARLDHEPTAEQKDDASRLIAETEAGLARYVEVDEAVAAGYVSIGDARSGVEHYINQELLRNETILDAEEPESLVYKVLPDGGRELTAAMYILPPGSTMDDVRDVAGNLTMWHGHDNLCWDESGTRLAGIVVNGTCRPGGIRGNASPMLHVWVVPNECGPFAGTDARQMTGSCIGEDVL